MFFKKFKLDKSSTNALGLAGIMGLHMVTHTFVGGVAGYYLDRWLETKPWLLIVFLLLGVSAGFRSVFQDTQKLLQKQAKNDAEKHHTRD